MKKLAAIVAVPFALGLVACGPDDTAPSASASPVAVAPPAAPPALTPEADAYIAEAEAVLPPLGAYLRTLANLGLVVTLDDAVEALGAGLTYCAPTASAGFKASMDAEIAASPKRVPWRAAVSTLCPALSGMY